MTYTTLKKILEAGNKNNVVTVDKLDVFLIAGRITNEEYNELLELLNK